MEDGRSKNDDFRDRGEGAEKIATDQSNLGAHLERIGKVHTIQPAFEGGSDRA